LTLQEFILSSVLPTLSILVASITLDSLYASKLSLPLVNFLYLNVFKNIASFYGTHPWHWYLSNAIPVTLATHIPFVVHGVIIGDRRLSYLAAGVVTVLSLIGHKEFRFLLPILPLLFCYAGISLEAIDRFREKKEREVRERINEKRQKRNVMSRINLALLFILSTNTAAAFYLTQIHQRGVIDVVFYLKHRFRLEPDQRSVFFLMPCHSTPLQTILHDSSIQIKTLSCEPPLRDDTVDESALFYDDKRGYLKEVEQHAWQYIVMFEVLDADSDVKQWMDGWYSFDKRFFNTHWHWDGKRKGDVVVYKRIT
jgi:GPI mannosyltransferase 3